MKKPPMRAVRRASETPDGLIWDPLSIPTYQSAQRRNGLMRLSGNGPATCPDASQEKLGPPVREAVMGLLPGTQRLRPMG